MRSMSSNRAAGPPDIVIALVIAIPVLLLVVAVAALVANAL
jgi:hypothetical protein